MYKRSSKHNFALAKYNLGHLKEQDNKEKESIEYYKKASKDEDCPLIFHNRQHYDKRLEISKTFIICLTNLKLAEYYFTNSDLSESKKYFVRAFSKLEITKEPSKYQLEYKINKQHTENLFIYLKNYILNFPTFNLINQPNLSLEIKKEIYSIFINNSNIRTRKGQTKSIKEKTCKLDKNESYKHPKLDFTEEDEYVKVQKIKFEKNNLEENREKYMQTTLESLDFITYSTELIDEENNIILEESSKIFEFIISNKEYKNKLSEWFHEIIEIMNKIIYTEPYPILFGRISIELPKKAGKTKDINELFYEGLNEIL